jgi:hypothetical protein
MSQEIIQASPCRHADAPSDWIIERIVRLLESDIPLQAEFLGRFGLTPEEYQTGYRVAIERVRGRISASDKFKKSFVRKIFEAGLQNGQFSSVTLEEGSMTKVYRVQLASGKTVGVIRKGCPDGNHTTRWEKPLWAEELYLWWLCPESRVHEPGESVWKGVARIKKKLLAEPQNRLDGVIFFDESCGTVVRPCPKRAYALVLGEVRLPPPCIYILPGDLNASVGRLNWNGGRNMDFPRALLSVFGVPPDSTPDYAGFVGVEVLNSGIRQVRISSNYGEGRITSVTS